MSLCYRFFIFQFWRLNGRIHTVQLNPVLCSYQSFHPAGGIIYGPKPVCSRIRCLESVYFGLWSDVKDNPFIMWGFFFDMSKMYFVFDQVVIHWPSTSQHLTVSSVTSSWTQDGGTFSGGQKLPLQVRAHANMGSSNMI